MTLTPPIRPTERLTPVDCCIYCGSRAGLSDEHVIPRGLNGTVVLPAATCEAHRAITSRIESQVQKSGFLSHPRLVLGMRSYKPKRKSNDIKVTFIAHDQTRFKKALPRAEAAVMLLLPMFTPPRYLTHSHPVAASNGIDIRAIDSTTVGRQSLRAMLSRHNAVGVAGTLRIDMSAFVRVLCKMAYGYHVAIRGSFDRDDSPALAVLLGERRDFGTWVGCLDDAPNVRSLDWHHVDIQDVETSAGPTCTIVRISLFNYLVPCTYAVVTRASDWRQGVQES
jgi:hypothetical protein